MGKGQASRNPLAPVVTQPTTTGEWVGHFLTETLLNETPGAIPSGAPEWYQEWSDRFFRRIYTAPEAFRARVREKVKNTLEARQAKVSRPGDKYVGGLLRLDAFLLQLYANPNDARREVLAVNLKLFDKNRSELVWTGKLETALTSGDRWVDLRTLGDWANAYWAGAYVCWSVKNRNSQSGRTVTVAHTTYVDVAPKTSIATLAQTVTALDAAREALLQVMLTDEFTNVPGAAWQCRKVLLDMAKIRDMLNTPNK